MGRTRSTHSNLPPRLHQKGAYYYYVTTTTPRRWIALGKDRAQALREWARMEGERAPAAVTTFRACWERYQREVLPLKALATQRDNERESKKLLAVFGAMQLEAITPQHVRQYLDMRSRTAQVRAKREKALLSHIFNTARGWGVTDAANPCAGIQGAATPGRDRYIEDHEYQAIWNEACQPLRDAMDLALLTGQRPADVLKMSRTTLRDGLLPVRQNKTGKKLRIVIEGELKAVIDRCTERAKAMPVAALYLVLTERGQRLSYRNLALRFAKARDKAGISNVQFRDIRAKAGTDSASLEAAQKLLGHQHRDMTEHYLRERIGDKVRPLR